MDNTSGKKTTEPKKRKKHLKRRTAEILFILAMLFLPVLQFCIFWIIPNFNSIFLGFQTSNGTFTTEHFTSFFEKLTSGKGSTGKYDTIVYSIINSLIYFAVVIFFCTPLVLFFSYVLFRKVPGHTVFRVIFYLPTIIGGMVMATLFRCLFFGESAPFYILLDKMGLITDEIAQKSLFGSSKTAFLMVIIYTVWTCVGLNMIMFHGAMKRIPPEIFESAEIDGAGFFNQFIHLVIPLIWPTISTLIIFSLSGMFVAYGAVMVLTPEVPEASMIGWYIVKETENRGAGSLGYPAAVGLVFTFIGLPFVLLVRHLLNKITATVEY